MAAATNGHQATEELERLSPRRRLGGTPWYPSRTLKDEWSGATGNSVAAPVTVIDASRPISVGPRTHGRRRRRRHRPWYRRPAIVGPVIGAIIALAAITVVVYWALSAFAGINSRSPLPPVVTDIADGGAPLPTGIRIDTGPAQAAIQAAGSGSGGRLGRFKGVVSSVTNLAEAAAVAAGVVDPAKDPLTILVMGVDARPGEPIDIGVRPDALMVLRLNPETGSCRLLAIPRDTRTELPGYGLTKINHALAVGGIAYQELVVERLLGLSIDHYVLIDFAGFKELVDAVGGVTLDVPEGFTYGGVVFTPGRQTLSGAQALAYARYRGGPDGDFGRIARQQQLLRALIRKAASMNIVGSINELLPAVRDHLRTDLTVADMVGLALQYRATCTEKTLQTFRLEGDGAILDDPLLGIPLWYLIVDETEIEKKVQMLLEP